MNKLLLLQIFSLVVLGAEDCTGMTDENKIKECVQQNIPDQFY